MEYENSIGKAIDQLQSTSNANHVFDDSINNNSESESHLLKFLSELNFNLNSLNLLEDICRSSSYGSNSSTAEEYLNNESHNSSSAHLEHEENFNLSPCITRHTLTVIKTERYKYLGKSFKGVRDGFGICLYPRGEVYIGQWKNDRKEGIGKVTTASGDVIQGELKENLFHGFVEVINHLKKTKITGQAVRGKLVGEIDVKIDNRIGLNINLLTDTLADCTLEKPICKINLSNGNCYYLEIEPILSNYSISQNIYGVYYNYINHHYLIGEFEPLNLQPNGYCEFYYKDKKYFGFFQSGKKNGLGLEILSNGKLIFGGYQNDLKIGPFFTITGSSMICSKMEIFHLGFISKIIEKHDHIKKYLPLNYPEYAHFLNFNYKTILERLVDLKEDEELKPLTESSPK